MYRFTILIKSKIMIALFLIALAVFAYIIYVLLKPEKF
ncbi:potassium-transporting ATPase subunit F [Flavobacterium gossypii]